MVIVPLHPSNHEPAHRSPLGPMKRCSPHHASACHQDLLKPSSRSEVVAKTKFPTSGAYLFKNVYAPDNQSLPPRGPPASGPIVSKAETTSLGNDGQPIHRTRRINDPRNPRHALNTPPMLPVTESQFGGWGVAEPLVWSAGDV